MLSKTMLFVLKQMLSMTMFYANIDNTKHSAHHHIGGLKGTAECFIDFSALLPSTADVIQCIKVDAGTLVTAVHLVIVVADAGTENVDIGDGDGTNSYDDEVDCTATAGTVTKMLEATDAYGVGRYYSSADTIDVIAMTSGLATAQALLLIDYTRSEDPTTITTLSA